MCTATAYGHFGHSSSLLKSRAEDCIMHCCIILYHIMSYHTISYYTILYYIFWHIISLYIILYIVCGSPGWPAFSGVFCVFCCFRGLRSVRYFRRFVHTTTKILANNTQCSSRIESQSGLPKLPRDLQHTIIP